MNLKKLYRRFFYLNTRSINSWQATVGLSSTEAILVLLICMIINKCLFPDFKISLVLTFSLFLIICFIFQYFNDRLFKKKERDYILEWESETKKNKLIYKTSNILFQVIVLSICLIILIHLDRKI